MPSRWETNCTQQCSLLPQSHLSFYSKPWISFLSMGIYTLFCKFKEKILANENYEKFLRVKEQRISLKRVIAAWNLCWIPLESTTTEHGRITRNSSCLQVEEARSRKEWFNANDRKMSWGTHSVSCASHPPLHPFGSVFGQEPCWRRGRAWQCPEIMTEPRIPASKIFHPEYIPPFPHSHWKQWGAQTSVAISPPPPRLAERLQV